MQIPLAIFLQEIQGTGFTVWYNTDSSNCIVQQNYILTDRKITQTLHWAKYAESEAATILYIITQFRRTLVTKNIKAHLL